MTPFKRFDIFALEKSDKLKITTHEKVYNILACDLATNDELIEINDCGRYMTGRINGKEIIKIEVNK
jgi:hypothetical protein